MHKTENQAMDGLVKVTEKMTIHLMRSGYGRVYKKPGTLCPMNSFELYLSKLPPDHKGQYEHKNVDAFLKKVDASTKIKLLMQTLNKQCKHNHKAKQT